MEFIGTKIHFMGIGGIGVSALAELAYRRGASVTGCDSNRNDRTAYLESLGIEVAIGHSPQHLEGVELLVYTSAIKANHPELLAAKENCNSMRRGTFLAQAVEGSRVLGVCGTHGKTTTTWLLGQLLRETGIAPTIILGGLGVGEPSNLCLGQSDIIVIELDESDGSFLEVSPTTAVITNVEADHLDHYGDSEMIHKAFADFANQIKPGGTLVACVDNAGSQLVYSNHNAKKISAGIDPEAMLHAEEITIEKMTQRFELYEGLDKIGAFEFNLPGSHNLQNALCALAAAKATGVDWRDLQKALPLCKPVVRRFEMVGEKNGITIIDDYAHHPSEVAAALKTARDVHPGRVVAIFQPHLYSRTRFFAQEFADALAMADQIILADIYPAREEPIEGVDSTIIMAVLLELNQNVAGPFEVEKIVAEAVRLLQPGDLAIFLGAGNIGARAHELLERL